MFKMNACTVGVQLQGAADLLDDLPRAHDDVRARVAHDARHLHAVPARAAHRTDKPRQATTSSYKSTQVGPNVSLAKLVAGLMLICVSFLIYIYS